MTVMLYRQADEPNPEVWDLPIEYRVFDEAEVPEALVGGWFRRPLDVPAAGAEPAPEPPKRRGRPPKEG